MEFTGCLLDLINKNLEQPTNFQDANSFNLTNTTQMDINSLQSKNVFLSGEFCPKSKNSLKENLRRGRATVQPEITPETEVIICGKYPDWILLEEAKLYGIKIFFIDKAGKYFSKIASRLIKNNSAVEELVNV